MSNKPITEFIEKYYLHFNSAALVDAAKGYVAHLKDGGKMMITLAGAMSTAEMGKILADLQSYSAGSRSHIRYARDGTYN